MLTLAIDPGVSHLAWALGTDDRLAVVGLIKNPGLKNENLGYFYAERLPFSHLTVIERSHFYKGESIYLLQDLLDVNIIAGYIAGVKSGKLISVAKWRGGPVPKKVQAGRTFKRLRPEELAILNNPKSAKDVDNNIMDAVGILFSTIGRFEDAEED